MAARHVLVTGASRGIGRVTALRLASEGWQVHAGVRRAEDGESLAAAHDAITPVILDVTDAEQVAALATMSDRLDAVVNNAGVAITAPLEGVPLDRVRQQLEVNVLGQLAVTQAVLPLLRGSKGRIVFVSSVSGRIATPMTGPYNASKFALEGMADALRLELGTWGVSVSLVEPAQTDTDMWQHAPEALEADLSHLSPEHLALYAGHIAGARKMIGMSQKMATSPDGVADSIVAALTSKRPRARYVVGTAPRIQVALSRIVPTRAMDLVLRTAAGVPRR